MCLIRALMRRVVLSLCAVTCLVLLSGCSNEIISNALRTFTSFKSSNVWLRKVSFQVDEKANDQTPLRINVVIVYKKELLKTLQEMTADEYFSRVDQLKRDQADDIDIFEWDLLNGQKLLDEKIEPKRLTGEGAIIFVRYASPGAHRYAIGEHEKIKILCHEESFEVVTA